MTCLSFPATSLGQRLEIPNVDVISRRERVIGSDYKASSLVKFSREGSCLKSRHNKISIDMHFIADDKLSVDYLIIMVVNGQPHAPFITTLLPGDMDVYERAVWNVFLPNPTNEVTLKILAVKEPTGTGERIINQSKFYRRKGKSC